MVVRHIDCNLRMGCTGYTARVDFVHHIAPFDHTVRVEVDRRMTLEVDRRVNLVETG